MGALVVAIGIALMVGEPQVNLLVIRPDESAEPVVEIRDEIVRRAVLDDAQAVEEVSSSYDS